MGIKRSIPLFITFLLLVGLFNSCYKMQDIRLIKLEKSIEKIELNYFEYSPEELQEKLDLLENRFDELDHKHLTDAQRVKIMSLRNRYDQLLLMLDEQTSQNEEEDLFDDTENDKELSAPEKSKSYYDDDDDDYSISIEEIINAANEDLPETIDEGMILTKMILEGKYIVYIYKVDPDIYDIDYIRENKNKVKNQIKSEILNSDDFEIQAFVKTCKKYHKGLAYRYVSEESGDNCTVYINQNEF